MNSQFASLTHASKLGALGRLAYVGSFLAFVGLAACSATVSTTPSGSCSADPSLECAGATGYSCTDGVTPTEALSLTDVACVSPSAGEWCCASTSTAGSCATTVPTSTCATGTPFTCTGTATPVQTNPSFTCTTDGTGDYCCNPNTTTNSACATNTSLSCVSGTSGWSCTGTSQPEDSNQGLVCSADQGTGDFCCSTSACNYDATVTCTAGAGYSCATGANPPDQADPTLVCSTPTTANSVDQYCCYTNTLTPPTGATCGQDQSVQGCDPGSYGFSCSGTDTPDQDFSNLTCSTGTGSGPTLFCCTYN
jgi:hypothetical protein